MSAPPEIPFAGPPKRVAVMRAALGLFLRDGYSETSMDAVTAAAGVSKATVYAHFPSKQELFASLLREGSSAAFAHFPVLARAGGDPGAEPGGFLAEALARILAGPGRAWDRLVIAEAGRQPENARLFYNCTFDWMNAVVAEYLAGLEREGALPPGDARARARAEQAVALALVGPLHVALLVGPDAAPRPAADGVRALLRGWAAPR